MPPRSTQAAFDEEIDRILRDATHAITSGIQQMVAAAIREAVEQQGGVHAAPVRPGARASTTPSASLAAAPVAARGTAPVAVSGTPAQSTTPLQKPASPLSSNALMESIRVELKAAFDGRPVSPDRIAFRIGTDRDLVDAALTLLVRQREARAMGTKGRIGYVPHPIPKR